MKTVIVGASSGLGRSIAVGLGRKGEQVALLARRRQRLEEAAAEAGADALAITCDVSDEASCRAAIDAAAEGLGGIDALVYAAGVGPLTRLVDMDADAWRRLLDTNLVGAAITTAAAVPHLAAAGGSAAYLSSTSASFTPPWPGLGAYSVSKAALDRLIEAWHAEHPEIGFTRVVVGECPGGEGDAMTQFNASWDQDLVAEVAPTWVDRGYLSGALLDVQRLVDVVDHVLRCGADATIPSVSVIPRPPR